MVSGAGLFWDLQILIMRIFDFPIGSMPTDFQHFITYYLTELIPYVVCMIICLLPIVVIYRLIRVFFGG